jgi:predicted DNA binding protein
MRFVSFKIRPEDRWFHPIDERIASETEMRHGPIHNIDMLEDGSVVTLYEVHGGKDRVDELLALEDHHSSETVAAERSTFVYTHYEPSPEVAALLEIAKTSPILIELPITFSDDNEIEVVIVGHADAIQETFTAAPESVQIVVEKTGNYRPNRQRLFAELTDRQQEILRTALEMGYYENPREATYGQIADALGCTATTVGEHLRKIERQVLREIAPGIP